MNAPPVTVDTYVQMLRDHLADEPFEVVLLHAYELGRDLVAEGFGLLDVVRLHTSAISQIEAEGLSDRARSDDLLTEVLGAFEMAYLGFQEANASLQELTASLESQVNERTRQLQDSLSRLQATDADRRRLLARLVQAQEDERHRLADDLHDDSIQIMVAVGLRLGSLRAKLDAEDQQQIDRLEHNVSSAIGRLRKLVFELRPPALDRDGLAAATRLYANETFDNGPDVAVHDRLEANPPAEARELLYRIIQEALANIRKHAAATLVDVTLDHYRGGIRACIVDNGRGFDLRILETARPGHLGVDAMRERAEMAGGTYTIDSEPDNGTTIECWIPTTEPATPPEGTAPSAG